jgi:vacuolar-type H+-ATPase subunit H
VPSVTIDRIDALRRHIADAVTQTTRGSMLPEQQQDAMLAQACHESCDLLSDWLEGPPLEPPRETNRTQVREFIRDQQQFAEFLSPLFADALKRARSGDPDPAPGAKPDDLVAEARREVAQAVRSASATARRHPRLTPRDLFQVSAENVSKLRKQVCELANQSRQAIESDARRARDATESDARRASWKRKALKALGTVGNVLLSLSVGLTVAALGAQMNHEIATVAHSAQIVIVHNVAVHAQPGVTVGPPRAGPQLR